MKADWEVSLGDAIASSDGPTALVGIGNALRGDDAVGLQIASMLRSSLGPAPRGVRIHEAADAPEMLLSKLAGSATRIIIFDAVDASADPGKIVCAKLSDTKYGFFATHNIPLRIVPGLSERLNDVLVVGVQPESLEVREGLSDAVRKSAGLVVDAVTRAVESRA